MAYYFLRHPSRPLVVVFSPKAASQSLRFWFTGTLEDPPSHPLQVGPWQIRPTALTKLVDHHRVLFVRDPLRRLVSFYTHLVVREPGAWSYADHDQRFDLERRTFRQLLFVLAHLGRHGLSLQHHLEPQALRLEGVPIDAVLAVEDLEQTVAALNRRFALTGPLGSFNAREVTSDCRQPVVDRPPSWLRRHGMPTWELFYDAEARALAERIYADDVALHRQTRVTTEPAR